MIDLNDLHIGDSVKIIDKWPGFIGQNNAGKMDKYLGKIVTVSAIVYDGFRISEDDYENYGAKWLFFPEMVDYILSDEDGYDNDKEIAAPLDPFVYLFDKEVLQ